MTEMRALSIMQPWAWLIVQGHKDVENRTWSTTFRGPVLIHAGKKADFDPADDWDWDDIAPPRLGREDFGGIVGEAEIVDCVRASPSRWFHGPHGFVIHNARPLPFRPCRGMLGFFVPDFTPAPQKPASAPRQGSLL
jgi:hypothetical protein